MNNLQVGDIVKVVQLIDSCAYLELDFVCEIIDVSTNDHNNYFTLRDNIRTYIVWFYYNTPIEEYLEKIGYTRYDLEQHNGDSYFTNKTFSELHALINPNTPYKLYKRQIMNEE